MGLKSRNKGKLGEREAARELARVLGIQARRGQQFSGGTESPDVVTDCDQLHIEVKRTESLRLYAALDQAIADAGDKTPIVLHRSNRRPWVVIVRLDDLPELLHALSAFRLPPNNSSKT